MTTAARSQWARDLLPSVSDQIAARAGKDSIIVRLPGRVTRWQMTNEETRDVLWALDDALEAGVPAGDPVGSILYVTANHDARANGDPHYFAHGTEVRVIEGLTREGKVIVVATEDTTDSGEQSQGCLGKRVRAGARQHVYEADLSLERPLTFVVLGVHPSAAETAHFVGAELGAKPVQRDPSPEGAVVYILTGDSKGCEAVVTDISSRPYLRHGDYAVRVREGHAKSKLMVYPSTELGLEPPSKFERFQPGDLLRVREGYKGDHFARGADYLVQQDRLLFCPDGLDWMTSGGRVEDATSENFVKVEANV